MVTIDERIGVLGFELPLAPTEVDERAARLALRRQIAKLERELAQSLATSFFAQDAVAVSVPASGGPRVLSLGELEALRDALAHRAAQARGHLTLVGDRQAASRLLLERMLLEPGRYKFVRVANADLGEGGCGDWHVRPRLGLIGMLMGWWHVKLSSGCPLAGGSRRCARPRPAPAKPSPTAGPR